MATVNFSVPDDLKDRFNKIFAKQNKSHLIAELMEQAIEEFERKQRRRLAIDGLLKLRQAQKPVSAKLLQSARELGRP